MYDDGTGNGGNTGFIIIVIIMRMVIKTASA